MTSTTEALEKVWGQLVGRSEWHDQDLNLCTWLMDAATKLEMAGRISPEAAAESRAYIANHIMKEHVYENPRAYRALRKEDEEGVSGIDELRNRIAGFDRDESNGATEERRTEAFRKLVTTAADVGFAENVVNPVQYEYLMSVAAPEQTQAVRQATLVPPKDDGGPREIDGDVLVPANDEQRDEIAMRLWLQRQDMGNAPDAPEPEPPVTGENEGRASDWSTARLERYFSQRDREQGIFHPSMSEPQDGPRGPLVPDHAGFGDERPYDPTTGE
jgi:hypothetical protein